MRKHGAEKGDQPIDPLIRFVVDSWAYDAAGNLTNRINDNLGGGAATHHFRLEHGGMDGGAAIPAGRAGLRGDGAF
jgi:hypothetical protein